MPQSLMSRMERQNKHHIPQRRVNFLHFGLTVVAVNWDGLFVPNLVVNIDRREALSESLDFKAQLQELGHLLSSYTHRFQSLLTERRTVNKQFPVRTLHHIRPFRSHTARTTFKTGAAPTSLRSREISESERLDSENQ